VSAAVRRQRLRAGIGAVAGAVALSAAL
jgi:surface-anchored protein